MDAERAYDFRGTHLPIYRGFVGQVTDQLLTKRQRVTAFGPGLALAQPLVVPCLEGDGLLSIEIGVSQGQPACLAIRSAHGQPLTGKLLRSLPLASLVTEHTAQHTYRVYRTRRGRYVGVYYSDAFSGMLGFEQDRLEIDADVARKRWKLDEAFLSQVAAVYRDALGNRVPPAQAVQERFGPTTPENARRWIMLARRAGKLGEAPGRGQAGEQGGQDG